MRKLVEIAKKGELADGAMKEVVAEGHKVLLARMGNRYYAVSNRRTHRGARLSDGKLEGVVVTCPRHGSQFDLSDGGVVHWLRTAGLISRVSRVLKVAKPLVTYGVKVEDDRILIQIRPSA